LFSCVLLSTLIYGSHFSYLRTGRLSRVGKSSDASPGWRLHLQGAADGLACLRCRLAAFCERLAIFAKKRWRRCSSIVATATASFSKFSVAPLSVSRARALVARSSARALSPAAAMRAAISWGVICSAGPLPHRLHHRAIGVEIMRALARKNLARDRAAPPTRSTPICSPARSSTRRL